MALFKKDTITALATAPLAAGVGVIRISGPMALEGTLKLCKSLGEKLKKQPRYAHFAKIHSLNGEALDEALIIYFQNPNSFTGEDVVEIHCHGGKATVDSILKNITIQDGIRMAEAGEFTRRAFLNGKLDLAQAEGLADLIHAETEEQRKQALSQLDGALGQQFESWRSQLMHLLAHVEAALDFPDEELEVLEDAGLKQGLEKLINNLKSATATNAGERLREGFSIAIVGRPNAGKSTLTNLLSGKETAIVSPIAGTTRDVVETHLNIGGFPVILADTAGLRITEDVIEQEGVKRATQKAQKADIVIMLCEASDWPNLEKSASVSLNTGNSLIIITKTDEANTTNWPKTHNINGVEIPVISTNLKDTEQTLPLILSHLEGLIRARFANAGNAALINRERHRQSINSAISHLTRALDLYTNPSSATLSLADLLAQDLRDAATDIGSITGRTDSEDVLDLVFSTFCIGK